MKKTTIGKIFIGIALSLFLYVQYVVVDRIFKQTGDLTEIYGEITNVQRIQIPKRYFGYNYAYALTINNEPLRFAIHEKNKKAFDFIDLNNVQGKKTKLLYSQKDYNSQENLTYHVYFLEIGRQKILTISESKQTDKRGLIIFIVADLFIGWMITFIMKKKRITKLNN